MKAPTLREMRRLLDGVIPPTMCSVAADGTPHVNYLSHVEYVDDEHVALTFQFLNRARANILATGRVALAVEDPVSLAALILDLRYLRTETEGAVFARLHAKLAGIAAQTGMEKVFHLRGADIYRVEALRVVEVPGLPLAGMAPRCDLATGVRTISERLAEADDLRALWQAFSTGLTRDLKIGHATVWMLDESGQQLYALASHGFPQAGSGAEMPLADSGILGVALRENCCIRIGHMGQAMIYGLAQRTRAEQLGLHGALSDAIPLPGLAQPASQLAVPLRSRGRNVGVLLVQSEHDQFFSYDDEDALITLGAQLAQGLATLHRAELADASPDAAPAAVAAAPEHVPAAPAGTTAPLRLRHYPRDHSVFVGDQYLIKGVAGAILARLVQERLASGREEFTTRELRLAGGDLRLPEVQDNLGVRLLLLERRLAERDFGLAIERIGRGRYRLHARAPLVLDTVA